MMNRNTTPDELATAAVEFALARRHGTELSQREAYHRLRDVMDALYWPSIFGTADQPPVCETCHKTFAGPGFCCERDECPHAANRRWPRPTSDKSTQPGAAPSTVCRKCGTDLALYTCPRTQFGETCAVTGLSESRASDKSPPLPSRCACERPNIKMIMPSGRGWCITCDELRDAEPPA